MPSARLSFFVGRAFKILLRFCVIFGATLLLFGILAQVSHAQETSGAPYTKPDAYNNVNPDVPNNLHTFSQVAIIDISAAIICQMIGIDVVHPEKGCLGYDPETKKIAYITPDLNNPQLGGLFGATTTMISSMYVPVASSEHYFQYLADNFGIHKAEAQGLGGGFRGLGAIQGLYISMRNIVYLILVVIFIIVGVAIMLRVKIDPRTVMSVQNQIPKLVMGIVFITFSFAVAGALIDVMWTITYFGINVIAGDTGCGTRRLVDPGTVVNNFSLTDTSKTTSNAKLVDIATQGVLNNPIAYMRDLLSDAGCLGSFDGVGGLALNIGKTLGDIMSRTILGVIGLEEGPEKCGSHKILGVPVFPNVTDCAKDVAFGLVKWLLSLTMFIIILAALYITLFKIWIGLLKAYVNLIIAIIVSPWWMLVGMLPGGGLGFMQWVRHMVAHLSVFPTTVFMFLLARVVAGNIQSNNPTTSVFLPPLIGNANIADNIGWITAFAFIMITPDMLNLVRDALKTQQGKYTSNITKRAKVNPMSPISSAGGMGYALHSLQYVPFVGPKIFKGQQKTELDMHLAHSAKGAPHPPGS